MAYKWLSYTFHALTRMEERGIREEEILRVLNGPDLTYPSYGKRVSEDVFEGGRLIRVVFMDTPGSVADAKIISAIDLEEDQAREVRVRQ